MVSGPYNDGYADKISFVLMSKAALCLPTLFKTP